MGIVWEGTRKCGGVPVQIGWSGKAHRDEGM